MQLNLPSSRSGVHGPLSETSECSSCPALLSPSLSLKEGLSRARKLDITILRVINMEIIHPPVCRDTRSAYAIHFHDSMTTSRSVSQNQSSDCPPCTMQPTFYSDGGCLLSREPLRICEVCQYQEKTLEDPLVATLALMPG